MSTVFLTNDLMFSSRATAAAGDAKVTLEVVCDTRRLIERMSTQDVRLVLLDLSFPTLDVADLVSKIRAAVSHHVHVVAFAPHVHEAKLDQARQAACDQVLTKGQFHSQIDQLLTGDTPR